jgi:hypothetical protein
MTRSRTRHRLFRAAMAAGVGLLSVAGVAVSPMDREWPGTTA